MGDTDAIPVCVAWCLVLGGAALEFSSHAASQRQRQPTNHSIFCERPSPLPNHRNSFASPSAAYLHICSVSSYHTALCCSLPSPHKRSPARDTSYPSRPGTVPPSPPASTKAADRTSLRAATLPSSIKLHYVAGLSKLLSFTFGSRRSPLNTSTLLSRNHPPRKDGNRLLRNLSTTSHWSHSHTANSTSRFVPRQLRALFTHPQVRSRLVSPIPRRAHPRASDAAPQHFHFTQHGRVSQLLHFRSLLSRCRKAIHLWKDLQYGWRTQGIWCFGHGFNRKRC